MQIRHLIRGGLLATGVGIGTAILTASAGAVEPLPSAPAAVPVRITPVAPATISTPVVIEAVEAPEIETVAAPAEESDAVSAPQPDPPVIQAGPGPVTPEPGVTTLIDPLVIDRGDAGGGS
jgi:hypothetical protein